MLDSLLNPYNCNNHKVISWAIPGVLSQIHKFRPSLCTTQFTAFRLHVSAFKLNRHQTYSLSTVIHKYLQLQVGQVWWWLSNLKKICKLYYSRRLFEYIYIYIYIYIYTHTHTHTYCLESRSRGISYIKYVNGRRTGLVTFCVETAFYNGLLKERYKGG